MEQESKERGVLVVDDDMDIRECVCEALQEEGYDVVQAANGAEALNCLHAAASEAPSLIILDLMMPVMDGWEFRDQQLLDATLAEIPVIVMPAIVMPNAKLKR